MASYTIERLHDYASLFSSRVCERAIRFDDVEDVRSIFLKYDAPECVGDISTWDYLSRIYRVLKCNYRNEYIYKNELLNHLLLKKLGKEDTIIINEFSVGNSVADVAFFNGGSKAFEIKSELDSDKRLLFQLSDYKQVFEECYIVVPEEQLNKYKSVVDAQTGIIVLSHTFRGMIKLDVDRGAEHNEFVNIDVLMRSVRADEYKWMVKRHYGGLPSVSCFEMYDVCRALLSDLSSTELHLLFNESIKRRKNMTHNLACYKKEARQMCLSLNFSSCKMAQLDSLYKLSLNQ